MGRHSNKCMHWIPLNTGQGNWGCDCGVAEVELAMEEMDFWDAHEKPEWMRDVLPSYLTYMGSQAYGCATPESDVDFYGCIVPSEEIAFPFLAGDIPHFGKQKKGFNQLQWQHMESETFGETDLQVYSLPYYFQLAMGGNPNLIDSLYTPDDVVVFVDNVGKMIRENRHLFLSQAIWHSFRGMAHHHMKKVKNRVRIGKRAVIVEKYGYDVKDASHVVRMMLQVEELLLAGNMDMRSNSETVSSVRNGEWAVDSVYDFFEAKEAELETLRDRGKFVLPYSPDEKAIKQLLVDCYEEKFGSLSELGWNTF